MSSPTATVKHNASRERVAHIVNLGRLAALDLMGVQISYLTEPEREDDLPCIMRGVIPSGIVVPLHMHDDPEIFFQVSGEMECLSMHDDTHEWIRVRPGDVVHIPGGAKHALRNLSADPSVGLLTTTSKMGRFFREIGAPIDAKTGLEPPSEETIRHFLETTARYGHWNATPEENAKAGISL